MFQYLIVDRSVKWGLTSVIAIFGSQCVTKVGKIVYIDGNIFLEVNRFVFGIFKKYNTL